MASSLRCAKDIAKWLAKNELNDDVYIYVNDGNRYRVGNRGDLIFDMKAEAKEYFDYAGNYLSLSTEGTFYDVLNYSYGLKLSESLLNEFNELLKKYGKYYELGDSWNLSLYDI